MRPTRKGTDPITGRGTALCQVSSVDELSFSSGFFLDYRCSGTLVHCIRSHRFRTSRSLLLWAVYEMGATLRRHFLRAVAAPVIFVRVVAATPCRCLLRQMQYVSGWKL